MSKTTKTNSAERTQSEDSKDITDFFLIEYDKLAQAHFSAHDNLSRWVRFYFLVVAAPLSFLVLVQSSLSKQGQITFFNFIPDYISIFLILVGIIGTFISLIIFDIRLDAALYARAVNGIRKYFLDNNSLRTSEVSKYVVMPTDSNKPSLTNPSINGYIFIFMFSIINSLYICGGSGYLGMRAHLYVPLFFMLMIGHVYGYIFIGKHKKNKYVRNI